MKNTNGQPEKKRLRRKNNVLKQKIKSLGGSISTGMNVPAEIENQFLHSVLAFENNYKKREKIKLFEKIGKPGHFKPVHEIAEDLVEQEWTSLYDHMYHYGIDLQVCSPNISARELYRFSVEELFEMDIEDLAMPGMMTCFIYDEFHPDHKYDNEKLVIGQCIMPILGKNNLVAFHFTDLIQFNQHENLRVEQLSKSLLNFHSGFDEIRETDVQAMECIVDESECIVSGSYKLEVSMNELNKSLSGNWTVHLIFIKDCGFWLMNKIEITGLDIKIYP